MRFSNTLAVRLFRRLDGSLRARLVIPTAAIAAVSSALMVVTASQLHRGDMEQAARERSSLFANLSTEATLAHMATYEHADVSELLLALKAHRTDIESLSVIGLDGYVGATTDRSVRGRRPWSTEQLSVRAPIELPGSEGFALIRPIPNDQRCSGCHAARSGPNGWLELRFSNSALKAARDRLWSALWLSELPSLLLLLGVSWWLLGREAVHPIQRLVKAMRRAAAGDASSRADEGRPDEIGLAARGFDQTMAALQQSQAELAEAYAQHMERADRFAMVGQMATGLAHEIKNPLAGLSGALELLAEDLAGSPRQTEVVKEMRHQVERLTGIMQGLLNFARPPKAQLKPTDINLAVENVFFLIGQQRNRAGIRIEKQLAADLPNVFADPGQLEQVFLNIGLNAYQSLATRGGKIVVRTAALDDSVVVEIADDGPGIPEEVRPNIFTPFFTTRSNGTGLGLALSMRLVTEHAGRLEFRCPKEGGTVFTVTLPLSGALRRGAKPPEKETASGPAAAGEARPARASM